MITMSKNKSKCDEYNLKSVRGLFTGAAPLGEETAEQFQKEYPAWQIRQGYGTCFYEGECSLGSSDVGSQGSRRLQLSVA